jgi:hypothetical protein
MRLKIMPHKNVQRNWSKCNREPICKNLTLEGSHDYRKCKYNARLPPDELPKRFEAFFDYLKIRSILDVVNTDDTFIIVKRG